MLEVIFRSSLRTHLSYQMTLRDLGNIHTNVIAVRIHFHVCHSTKTIPVFLPADGETSWSLLPSSVSLQSGGKLQPENMYSCILKVTGQVWESQKRMNINTITATTSIHLSKPVSAESNNKIRFSFKQPNRKRWGAKLADVIKHLPDKVFLLSYDP